VSDGERIRPRFELEDRPMSRLEPEALPAVLEPTVRGGSGRLATAGVALLVVGLTALQAGNFVADQFARSAPLGWVTLGVAAGGFGLVGAGVWRELRGLFAVRSVDQLRAAFADPARVRDAARHWLRELPEGPALLPAIEATNDPDAILALLRAGPAATLRAQAEALGRGAALQVFAAGAAIPSPAFDALLVAWRGARLVRQIAELHGLRPGLLGTLSLLRRTALSAATVLATDVAADAMARALLSNPLFGRLAGDVAGAGVAARRMVVLARVTEAACSPLERIR